jgi:hypothetical protein
MPLLRQAAAVGGYLMRPILIALVLFICCNDQRVKVVEHDNGQGALTLDTVSKKRDSDTSQSLGTRLYVWQVDYENKTKTKNPQFQDRYFNVDTIIKGLNELYPKIQLEKIKISRDTLYTEIKDSYYLGESIGSYGANAYVADAVINLTSVKNINYVRFDFEDGSHISPGTWSREQFKEYIVKQKDNR